MRRLSSYRSILLCGSLVLLLLAKSARPLHVHAAQDGPHGTVTGKLTGADGAAIGSAWITAIPAHGDIDANNPEQLTNDDGTFSIDVPPGVYFIVANFDWPATRNAPVLTTYYPGAETETGAKAVSVKVKETVKGIDIKVTRVLVEKTVEVAVTGTDGQPVPSADAYLTQTNQAGVAGSDSGATYANKAGLVKLTGFEGIDYLVWAENGIGAKKTCAPMQKLDKDHPPPTGPVAMQLTLAQPACRQQEDAARKAAYAMQTR